MVGGRRQSTLSGRSQSSITSAGKRVSVVSAGSGRRISVVHGGNGNKPFLVSCSTGNGSSLGTYSNGKGLSVENKLSNVIKEEHLEENCLLENSLEESCLEDNYLEEHCFVNDCSQENNVQCDRDEISTGKEGESNIKDREKLLFSLGHQNSAAHRKLLATGRNSSFSFFMPIREKLLDNKRKASLNLGSSKRERDLSGCEMKLLGRKMRKTSFAS